MLFSSNRRESMGNDDVLLVAGDYPHALMQHMNTLVKEKGRSVLWDGSFVQLFEDTFQDFTDERFILETAYGLGIPKRFQEADKQAVWSKRVCITQSLFLLVQCMKEYEAVMLVESFMFLLGWDFEVSVQRKWEVREEDKANFHQPHERKAMGQADLERMAREEVERKKVKEGGRRKVQNTERSVPASDGKQPGSGGSQTGMDENDRDGSGQTVKAVSERKRKRRASDRTSGGGGKSADEPRPPAMGSTDGNPLQEMMEREVMFAAQMNLSMRREVKRAKKGNADSQQALGSFYSEEGTKHLDYKEAVYWYKLSADQGNYKSQLELGRIFDSGKIQEEGSKAMGIYWYRKLAEEGFPTAQCILGAKYLWGDGVEENKREAVHWFKKAAAQGHEEAQGYLSGLLKQE